MSQHNMDYLARRLLLAFFTAACQFILFGPIFIIYMVFIPWPPRLWFLFAVPYILIPMLSAFGCCFLINRSNFHFDSRNMVSKVSVYRLAVRLMSVFCILLIGYTLDKKNVVPIFVSNLLNKFGEYAGTFESLLTSIFFYIFVAIFPTVFALVEYLFVEAKSAYGADS